MKPQTPTEIKAEIEKGCGAIFGSNRYKDMNPRKCGFFDGEVVRLCGKCQEFYSGLILAWKNELEFLESEGIKFYELLENKGVLMAIRGEFSLFLNKRINQLKEVVGEKDEK